MIAQNKKFDTYCTHPQCIQNKNALFIYTPNNYHQQKNHKVKILHPLKVKSIVQSLPQNQQNPLLYKKSQLIKRVEGYIRQFCDRINSFVIQKYLSPFVDAAKIELQQIKVNDSDQIFAKLQQGDHQTLQEYINCCKNGVNNTYPFQNYENNRIKEIDTTIAKQIEDLYLAFQKIIAVTFERKEDFLKVAEGQFQTISDLGKDQLRKTFKLDEMSPRRRINNQKSNENIQKYMDLQNSNDFIMENENYSNDLMRKSRKRKLINKGDKRMKTNTQNKRVEERRSPKQTDIPSEITQVARDEIRINTCSYGLSTLNYILQYYKDLSKIHIFSHKFAKKEILERLFHHYKNLKVITLNCVHQFQSKLMNGQNLEKIENLQLKWDFDNFFKEYQIFKYFPTKNRALIQNLNKTNISLDLLLALKNNKSLSINFEKQIDGLAMSSLHFENIKTLHYSRVCEEKNPMPFFNRLLRFQFSQLTTLHLSYINIYDYDRQFGQFLKKNRGITTLVMSHCKIPLTNAYNPAKIFQHLRELVFLKKLSYSPEDSVEYVKAENIFCLKNLEELHLFNCNLLGNTNNYYEDSSMLREIKNLPKLTQLSLYACNPVFSDLFRYMEKETLERIQYLNIGFTQVENSFANIFLPLMKRLKYLNIDSTNINGRNLLVGFQKYLANHQKESPLQYLSIQSKIHPNYFDTVEIKRLSTFIPNLVYIMISKCKSLRGYGFEEYKNLKYLAVDYEQQSLLQKKLSPNVQIYVQN